MLMTWQLCGRENFLGALVELEGDIDFEDVAGGEAGGERIDLLDAIGGDHDGLIHGAVAGGMDDFAAEDGAILADAELQRGGEILRGVSERSGLIPSSVESIVEHGEVPAEFRGAGAAAGFAGA